MVGGKVEVLLVVSGFDVDRSAEAKLVNMYVNLNEGDMRGRDGPGGSVRIANFEALREKENKIMTMSSFTRYNQ